MFAIIPPRVRVLFRSARLAARPFLKLNQDSNSWYLSPSSLFIESRALEHWYGQLNTYGYELLVPLYRRHSHSSRCYYYIRRLNCWSRQLDRTAACFTCPYLIDMLLCLLLLRNNDLNTLNAWWYDLALMVSHHVMVMITYSGFYDVTFARISSIRQIII